jgi:hypothetical protein
MHCRQQPHSFSSKESLVPQHLAQPCEGWIAADPSRGGVRVLITGPQGFERTVAFALDEAAATITQRVKETIDD